MRNEHVRLQIANATLDTQVKQIETSREEFRRDIKELEERYLGLLSQVRLAHDDKEGLRQKFEMDSKEMAEKNARLSKELLHARVQLQRLKDEMADMETEKVEVAKSRFSLRDIYRRPRSEWGRPQTGSSF